MKSIAAGIIDRGGGLRVVVDDPRGIQSHVLEGERLFILPDFEIDEDDLTWDNQFALVKRVEDYVAKVR